MLFDTQISKIRAFIRAHEDEWRAKYGIAYVAIARKEVDGIETEEPCIQFTLHQKEKNPKHPIPKAFEIDGHRITTDVVEEDEITADGAMPGDLCKRGSSKGTLGLKVVREENGVEVFYALSCYHVFCASELSNGTRSVTNYSNTLGTRVFYGNEVIGRVHEGYFNSRVDAAIARLEKDGIPDESVMHSQVRDMTNNPYSNIKVIQPEDIRDQIAVYSRGGVSGKQYGKLKGRILSSMEVKIMGAKSRFRNIIKTSKISVKGDSGAAVFDAYGKTIGIVFASNSTYSYLIPISEILTKFNIKICHT